MKIPADASYNVQSTFREIEGMFRDIEKRLNTKPAVTQSDLDDVRRDIAKATRRPTYQTWEEVFGNYPTNKLKFVGLPVYANNAAAVTGGLAVGNLYRTGGDPDPVCVVH